MLLDLLKDVIIIWMLLFSGAVTAADSSVTPPPPPPPHSNLRSYGEVNAKQTQQHHLNKGKAQWYNVQSNNRYYRYNYHQDCNTCARLHFPWRVKLESGKAPVAIDTEGKQHHSGVMSIASMFEKLQNDILNPDIKSLEAQYDAVMGYPTNVRTEYADGFVLNWRVFNFQFEEESAQGELTRNKDKWESQGIRNYDFTYYEESPNPHGIEWPLLVQVRDGKPSKTFDRNGKEVTNLIPQTLDQYFSTIQRQLNKEGVFVDNEYSKRGYASNIDIVTPDIGEIKIHFCTFSDLVAPT